MAHAISAKAPDLNCPICLEVLKDPATLQCGHNFCVDCIQACLDWQSQSGVFQCPQCRQPLSSRPALSKNIVLAELIQSLGPPPPAGPPEKVEAGDVACDVCSGTKLKAVKFCLVCLASYCSTHLQPHYDSAAFKSHQLVDVSASVEEMICLKHRKVLEVFCRTDGQCVCLLCVMDEHKSHDTVSAAAERKEREEEVAKKHKSYQEAIKQKQKQQEDLKKTMKMLKSSAGAARDESESAFAQIVATAEERRRAVAELMDVQERAAMGRAQALVGRLEKEISELRRMESSLERLSQTDNHVYFLQQCQAVRDYGEPEVAPHATIHLLTPFQFVTKAFSDLREKLQDFSTTISNISKTVMDLEPRTRAEFSMYSCQLLLDPCTAFENLSLSEGNRKVTWVKKRVAYPPHPDRFVDWEQVLCTEPLTGVCYWEVQWAGPRVEVAVSCKGAGREESAFGYSDGSWCLSLSSSACAFWHNGVKTKIRVSCCSTVGVYLNQAAGALSFYSLPATGGQVLLHKVQTTFTRPVYAGFMVCRGSSVCIVSAGPQSAIRGPK